MTTKKYKILFTILFFNMLSVLTDESMAMIDVFEKDVIKVGVSKFFKALPKIKEVKRKKTEMTSLQITKKNKIVSDLSDLSVQKNRNIEIANLYGYYLQNHFEHSGLYNALLKNEENKNHYIGVITTGIYCRFGCPAGPPLAKNTVFSKRSIDLLSIGLRECKRCFPLSHGATGEILKSLQFVEKESFPKKIQSVPVVSESQWISNEKDVDLVRYVQTKRVMHILANKHDITFPTKSSILYQKYWTPIGFMIGCFYDKGLLLLEFMDRRALEQELLKIQKKLKATFKEKKTDLSQQLEKEIEEYFKGSRKEFTIPLHFIGSDFQQSVWKNLQKIPYGGKNTYKEQAISIGNESASRAVANANGSNKISILVPCHRVVGTDGKLTGYGGGLERKEFLLNLEIINSKNEDN